jgi:hypothetical protein
VLPAATGKSVLSAALAAEQQASLLGADPAQAGSSSSSSSRLTVQVLNSDLLKAKQGISGMRYWHQVRQLVDLLLF